MTPRPSLALLPLLALVCAPARASAATAAAPPVRAAAPVQETPAQEKKDEPADKRPEVAELCDALKDHVAARGDEDDKAIEVIDKLVLEFPRSGPKDRAAIAKAVSKCLEAHRTDEEVREEGEVRVVPNDQLYLACAVALGEMGPESTKLIAGWIGDKRHRKDLELQRRLALALGRTRDPDGLRTLVDLLTNKDAPLVAAAAEALAYFENAPLDTRKDLFGELLKALMTAKGSMDSDPNDTIARDRYNTFSAAIVTTLDRLAGLEERDPEALQRWWNKNKHEDWDQER
jgi:hypothetical protein